MVSRVVTSSTVIPMQMGIQKYLCSIDSRLRGNDRWGRGNDKGGRNGRRG